MSQAVKLDVFYPYPPERVWQVLTDRRALAAWMMDNDFEPKLGNKFRFHSQPLPGLSTMIRCEVVELEEPKRLVYTWQESSTAEPSLVIWTLTAVAGGTQVQLKHQQHSYTTAVDSLNSSSPIARSDRNVGLLRSEMLPVASGLRAAALGSGLRCRTQFNSFGKMMALELSAPPIVAWDYCLNQTLPDLLAQSERSENWLLLSS